MYHRHPHPPIERYRIEMPVKKVKRANVVHSYAATAKKEKQVDGKYTEDL
jgi:hypothetical protein